MVVDARYGVLDAILAAEAADAAAALRTAARDGVPAAAPADADDAGGAGHAGARDDGGGGEEAARGAREGRQGAAHEGEEEEEDGDEEDAADAAAVAAAAAARAAGRAPPPPPWVDVTAATRFLVARGRIVLHQARGARAARPAAPRAKPAALLSSADRAAAPLAAAHRGVSGARMPPGLLMSLGLLSSRAPCPDPVSDFPLKTLSPAGRRARGPAGLLRPCARRGKGAARALPVAPPALGGNRRRQGARPAAARTRTLALCSPAAMAARAGRRARGRAVAHLGSPCPALDGGVALQTQQPRGCQQAGLSPMLPHSMHGGARGGPRRGCSRTRRPRQNARERERLCAASR